MSFRIAMQSRRAMSSLSRPHEVVDQSYDFLIAHRVGGADEHLILSEAGPCTGGEGRAPDDLRARHVMIGTLVSRGPEPGTETFLLNSHIPYGARFRGLFQPADGFLRLTRSSVGALLSGVCRLSNAARPTPEGSDCGDQTIVRALATIPDPVGCVLQIDAAYVPWAQEILPPDALSQQPVTGDCR